MDREGLVILKSAIGAQVAEIEKVYAKIDERRRGRGKASMESVAYQLHNLYCAYEDLFKTVANAFENHIQDAARYHVELLKRMTMSMEGIRPALISQESYVLLDNLRSFRHFFRHAYSYELDERKVRIVLDDALSLRQIYLRDIDSFLEALL